MSQRVQGRSTTVLGPLSIGLTVFLAAAAIRGLALLLRKPWLHGFNPDYGWVALNLSRGLGFSLPYNGSLEPTAMVSPLVVYLQSTAYKLLGNPAARSNDDHVAVYAALHALNLAVHVLAMLLVYRVTTAVLRASAQSRLVSERQIQWTGLGTALAATLYPPFVHYNFALNETGWTLALLLLSISFLLRRPVTGSRAALAGLSLGVAALAHPTNLFILLPASLWAVRWSGARGVRRVLTAAVLLGCTGLATSPWLVRNGLVFGRFVPIKSNFGICMYVLNMPGSSGVNWPYGHDDILPLYNFEPGPFVSSILPTQINQEVADLHEVDKQYYFFGKTLEIIGEHPLRYVGLSLKRLAVYLTYPFGRNRPPYTTTRGIVYLAFFLPFFFLACIAMADGFRSVPEAGFVAACAVAVAVGFALMYVGDLRYKQPFEVLLFPLAGNAAAPLVAALWRKRN